VKFSDFSLNHFVKVFLFAKQILEIKKKLNQGINCMRQNQPGSGSGAEIKREVGAGHDSDPEKNDYGSTTLMASVFWTFQSAS
jgi:hypothetical protein